MVSPAARRAERLEVALFIYGTVRQPPKQAYRETFEHLTLEDFNLCLEITQEDVHLANACLELEAEVRVRQWAALERLLALLPAGEEDRELFAPSDLIERVEALPDSTFRPAARALYELGWLSIGE